MHPDPKFRWNDADAMRGFVREVSFGMLCVTTPEGPRVVHVPAVWLGEDRLGLHVARGNAVTKHLDGAQALFVVNGPDGYISPDWYGLGPDQVPTWNYLAVELDGRLQATDRDGLLTIIAALSHEHEARLVPKPEWTLDKVDPGLTDRLVSAITGFTLDVTGWRGTRKLGQNKPEAVRLAAADALRAAGGTAMADRMRSL